MATVRIDLGLALESCDRDDDDQAAVVHLAMMDCEDPVSLTVFPTPGVTDGCHDEDEQTVNLTPRAARVLAAQLLAAASQADARGGSSPDDE